MLPYNRWQAVLRRQSEFSEAMHNPLSPGRVESELP
jgi:hypothetical protein